MNSLVITIAFVVAQSGWQAKPDVVAARSKGQTEFNYDEAAVKPYVLPDPLTLGGRRVKDVREWAARRAEILELFRANVYGRRPGQPQDLRFEVVEENTSAMDGAATLKRVAVHSAQDGRTHRFDLTIFLPNGARGPVPLFLLLNNRPATNVDPTRKEKSPFWPAEAAIARGYGIAALQVADLAPDDRAKFSEGVIRLFEGTPPARAPDAWAALAAWGWGASRAMDYFETDPRIDAKRVGVVGHSRGGKAALWAGAEDERFAIVVSNESGEGGAALTRRNYGETLGRITTSFPHWFAGHYKSFAGREDGLPIDQHMLIGLIAPRAVYVASADEDLWSDPRGEFLALAHASPVFALWGEPPIGESEMPALEQPLMRGRRGYHVRPGVHNLLEYDWQRFMDFADSQWKAAAAAPEPREKDDLAFNEEIFVSATRSGTRLIDQPLRVEVIDREEIEEKALMTPGSVAMLLGETSGLRVQTTAPSLGAANVRIQGLRGRYAQLIADGLPLYGAQGDSLSLLQVPPLDLGQVEVIKGVASALYGASALGGVINLVSRRPRAAERELLVNRTTQEGSDVTAWVAQPTSGHWSWTLLGGYHGQEQQDLDDDGWADQPSFDRGLARPRVFYDNKAGRTMFATLGVMGEDRAGGTVAGIPATGGRPFVERLATRHVDSGVVARWLLPAGRIVAVRGSVMRQSRDRRFGDVREHGVRATSFGEASLTGVRGRHTWVAGAAVQHDRYDLDELPQFDYRFTTGSGFLQDEFPLNRITSVAASVRLDVHSEYGVLATPRVSLLARPGTGWTMRVSTGTGAFTPTPFTEETDETGLTRVLPLRDLRAERAVGSSFDLTRTLGPFEVTGTVFGSVVSHPLQRREVSADRVELINAGESTRTWGTELIGRYRIEGFVMMATHAWTRSTELDVDTGLRREVPLTPRHAGSLNAIWEGEEWGRFGIEVYFTGRQMLEDNPYRDEGKSYWLVGLLGERRWKSARFFLNAENIFDIRQTKYDPLVLPARLSDGRWTVDAWAPLDGRVVNGGVRLSF